MKDRKIDFTLYFLAKTASCARSINKIFFMYLICKIKAALI